MNELVTIVRQLGQLSRDLDKAVEKLGELEEIAVDAKCDYEVAFAKVFGSAAGSVEDRKQLATIEVDALSRVSGKAAAVVRLQKESIKALHARLDTGRTMSANVRAEVSLAGAGFTP